MHKSLCKRRPVITDPHFGPLGKYLEAFRYRLLQQGHAEQTVNYKMCIARHLNKWLHQRKLRAKDLRESTVRRFLGYYHKYYRPRVDRAFALQGLLDWLRQKNVVPKPVLRTDRSKLGRILRDYAHYLKYERGLSPATLKNYLPTIRCFLSQKFRRGKIMLRNLTPTDISKFVFSQTKVYSLRRVQLITTALRSFCRFLRFRGDIKSDLAATVPAVADRRQLELPKYLPADDINKLIESCDRTRPTGIRDYAMLLLMARLGLRAGEMLNLTLDDINWQAGVITIHGKTGRQELLPIPTDVGQALVRYLKKARPKCTTRKLFLRTKAPFRGLARNGCVCSVVRYACRRVGISPPHQGAHLLRHSLATRMLREGASMTDIAEILRHRSPATTEIYAKVDLAALGALAQPWPRGAP